MTSPGGNDINLATLWIPVTADTSKVAAQAREGAEHFKKGFAGQEVGAGIGAQIAQGLLAGFQKSNVGGGLSSMLGGLNLTKLGVVAGITAAVVAVEKLGEAFIHAGEEMEAINRQIVVTTSISGPALDELKEHADRLVGTLDTATNKIGTDMATMAGRLHMEAGPELDQLTRHVEILRDRLGNWMCRSWRACSSSSAFRLGMPTRSWRRSRRPRGTSRSRWVLW